jgi:MFS family permease
MQGLGDGLISTACKIIICLTSFTGFSLITIEFKDNPDKYVGYAELANSFGLLSGPALGSIIYNFSNYELTFIVFGIIIEISAFSLIFLLPDRFNKDMESTEEERLELI